METGEGDMERRRVGATDMEGDVGRHENMGSRHGKEKGGGQSTWKRRSGDMKKARGRRHGNERDRQHGRGGWATWKRDKRHEKEKGGDIRHGKGGQATWK